jgi:hypothetical protein
VATVNAKDRSGTVEAAGSSSGRAVGDARSRRFRATPEAEARLLLLIDGFSRDLNGAPRTLEGRVKLAKLDFLIRYPRQLSRVVAGRPGGAKPRVTAALADATADESPFDARMVRYRYGPWDPAYYALLGSLIGRGLVEMIPLGGSTGYGYRTTGRGEELAVALREDDAFTEIVARTALLRRHLDLNGTTLKRLLYELPEVADASWHEELQ